MSDSVTLETMPVMQAMQFSMDYSNSVTKLAMECQEIEAQTMMKMMPPVVSPEQHIIDTYA